MCCQNNLRKLPVFAATFQVVNINIVKQCKTAFHFKWYSNLLTNKWFKNNNYLLRWVVRYLQRGCIASYWFLESIKVIFIQTMIWLKYCICGYAIPAIYLSATEAHNVITKRPLSTNKLFWLST